MNTKPLKTWLEVSRSCYLRSVLLFKAMAKTVADAFAAHNPKDFEPFPYISESNTPGSKPRLTIVVACIDPRCSVDRFIGMNVGSSTGEMVMVSYHVSGSS
ncbi:hypothetical protein BKA56DRAFT_190790 [Ilyonectria sp. MPI-CAGE-AT-0026]|nr:hypothetical protein BKA56DRAFT_190790 [Ilyonectria sp. MPI-CAGE-AT-0026]